VFWNLTLSFDSRFYNSSSTLLQKREAPTGEKPEPVRTHLRNMIIVPEMIGSVIGVYNGKTFNQVEIKVCLSRSLWDDTYFQVFPEAFGCKTERNLYTQHGHHHPTGATGF
jgi:hypothetical protein